MYYLGTRSQRQLIGVNPYLAFAVYEAIKITKQDFGIIKNGGLRSEQDQDDLYAQGRTTPGIIVTWTRESNHEEGNAVDLVPFVNGNFTWEDKYFAEIAEAMKIVIAFHELPIEWLYDVKGIDKPHWQVTTDFYDIRKIKGV